MAQSTQTLIKAADKRQKKLEDQLLKKRENGPTANLADEEDRESLTIADEWNFRQTHNETAVVLLLLTCLWLNIERVG